LIHLQMIFEARNTQAKVEEQFCLFSLYFLSSGQNNPIGYSYNYYAHNCYNYQDISYN
jgi:hypothetical protein